MCRPPAIAIARAACATQGGDRPDRTGGHGVVTIAIAVNISVGLVASLP
jgi:hypothetical protein